MASAINRIRKWFNKVVYTVKNYFQENEKGYLCVFGIDNCDVIVANSKMSDPNDRSNMATT